MQETVLETLTRLLRYQRAPISATKQFQELKHDKDILPAIQDKLEVMLRALNKFEEVVYDIQGIRDDGADIVLRSRATKSNDQPELICFQVKSFSDLSEKSYLQQIKAQRDDAFRKIAGIQQYFIFLCTDLASHKPKVRAIAAEFKSALKTEVIEPQFAFTFLHHPQTRIEALIKRIEQADDIVVRDALESLDQESPSARALALYLFVRHVVSGQTNFKKEDLLNEPVLKAAYSEMREKQASLLDEALGRRIIATRDSEEWDEEEDEEDGPAQIQEFEEQIGNDLELLDNGPIEANSSSEIVRLRPEQSRALVAVISDAAARYEYSESQLMNYMFDLFIRE
jgi:hypothetical protein